MNEDTPPEDLVQLDTDHPIGDRFFFVAPGRYAELGRVDAFPRPRGIRRGEMT